MSFKEIGISELRFNPFTKFDKEWAIVTAGNENGSNGMTISWGFMGVMWGKNVIETVIRNTRHTLGFMEENDLFTVSFYGEEYRKALMFFGSHSGRDCDKAAEAGLTPCFIDGAPAYEEASLVFVCRKLYSQDMDITGLCEEERHWYADGDMHKVFIGEIVKVMVRE